MINTIYEALVEQSPVMIWRAGTDTRCDYFNQTWLEFRGRTLQQEMGEGWTEGIHKDDYEFCLNTYLENFKNQQIFEMEYRLERYDGTYRWIFDRGCPYYNDKGQFLGYIGSCIDVTDKHLIEIEKEKIYKATIRGANHILRNMLNQLQIVNLECESYPELYQTIESYLNTIVSEAEQLVSNLSSVKDINEQNIIRSVAPKNS